MPEIVTKPKKKKEKKIVNFEYNIFFVWHHYYFCIISMTFC